MAVRELMHARGEVPISSLVAEPATTTRSLLLGNLATALRQEYLSTEEFLRSEQCYVVAIENGEGVRSRDIDAAKQKLKDNCQGLDRFVAVLLSVADAADEGYLDLPDGATIVCLQSSNDGLGSMVFVLPGNFQPRLASDAPDRRNVEGVKLYFYGQDDDRVKPLLAAEPGTRVNAPWDDTKHVVTGFITAESS